MAASNLGEPLNLRRDPADELCSSLPGGSDLPSIALGVPSVLVVTKMISVCAELGMRQTRA